MTVTRKQSACMREEEDWETARWESWDRRFHSPMAWSIESVEHISCMYSSIMSNEL